MSLVPGVLNATSMNERHSWRIFDAGDPGTACLATWSTGKMERIHSLDGIELHLNCEIGSDISFEELEKRHDENIIAAGAGSLIVWNWLTKRSPAFGMGKIF